MGLAQLEKLDWFVSLRQKMAAKYRSVIESNGCDWLVPQKAPDGDVNSYYTFAAKYTRKDIPWVDFRKKYVEFGGDGIYAAWALCYLEDSVSEIKRILEKIHLAGRFRAQPGLCPVAEEIQGKLMQFTTNQKDEAEMDRQAECLDKTIRFFS